MTTRNRIINALQWVIIGALAIYLVVRYAGLGWLVGH